MVWCAFPVFFKRRRQHNAFRSILWERIKCRSVNKMAEAPDDIELQNFEEQKEEEKGEEETNVDEDDDFVTGILGLDTSSPPSVP